MSAKDKLKATVETLSEAEAAAALEFIVREVEGALVGDEPVTPDEEAALAEVDADRTARVPTIPFDDLKRKYNVT